MNKFLRLSSFFLFSIIFTLSGCGGGGGGATPPTTGNSSVGAPSSIVGYTVVQTVTRNDGQPNVIGVGKTITYSFINANTILGAGLYTLPTTSWSYGVNGNVASVNLVYGTTGWARDTWTFTSPRGGTYHSDTGLASGTQGWHEGTFVVSQYSGTGKTLSSIAVTPTTAKLPVGKTTNLVATGTYSDGTTADITKQVTWASAAPAVASIDSATGTVTALAKGTATITAAMYGITSSTSTITVIDAPLASISITPSSVSLVQGASKQFAATGTYSDGTLFDLTATVTWASSNTAAATINASGLATGIAAGTSVITATSGAISGSTTMTVTLSTIGGTVSGLAAGNSITLQNNGGDTLTVAADGGFTFATPLQNGAAYNVTILNQPTGQPCSSTYTAGMVNATNIANVNIFCGPAPVGAFSTAASMTSARKFHTSTLLPNGKVLVTGGISSLGQPISNAELYDPATNSWISAGNMSNNRLLHTATLLPNGKVLVVGGDQSSLYTADLYDPVTNTWGAAARPAIAYREHTATLLHNGKVLVAGGYTFAAAQFNFNAELYDPATNTWAAAGSMATMRFNHTATLLPSGKVLVAGGKSGCACNSFSYVASAELYDPATNTWMAAGNLASTRGDHTATLLPNGKVLVAGGQITGAVSSNSAELYDPATNIWSAAGSMVNGHKFHTATLLPTGKVLVAGGLGLDPLIGITVLARAELYDPATNSWATTGGMAQARQYHTAVLANGKLLVIGGEGYVAATMTILGSAERYW